MTGRLRRRIVSIPALFLAAIILTITIPLWVLLAAVFDLARGRFRLPTVRLLSFGVCWAWLEVCGVTAAFGLWCAGRSRNHRAQYALQRWWAARLMGALRVTTGIAVEAAEASALSPGPTIMLCRHASLADSLVSAWVVTSQVRMNPRYVLKRELLVDPCLDVVGNRLPNHFLDRGADDSSAELAALRELAAGLRADEVGIIFPEGTRAASHKRERALAKIGERDPQRAATLAPLQHLLPPRPAGAAALLAGCPTADVVVAWHVGFDGLDTFGGILRHLSSRPLPVQFHAIRVRREQVPAGEGFTAWLDHQWLQADAAVHQLLNP
ncbi:MAG: 1-acyl-sn-glycerol-3-phosphate acyltransferase [Actinomycetota bacterium]|nr:1-acyl-sn-glycerol-3-phosphate acyltransferase [Actinomycetota bacterium]